MLQHLIQTAVITSLILSTSCTYLKHASIQADYARLQKAEPSQRNVRHMIERQNFAVIGKIQDPNDLYRQDKNTKAVAAFSSRFKANELVEVMHDMGSGTHFGLDLPSGDYDILVFSDRNRNRVYDSDEVVGKSQLSLSKQNYPSMVVTQHIVEIINFSTIDWQPKIEVKETDVSQPSIYYPAGTIRSLRDPIFSHEISTLGLYDPAAFFEQVPTMFHALEEDIAYKIPVIFVYGIGGSPREFEALVQQLDRSRFKPWFYHYASGGDLNQMAALFHDIFLSGKTIGTSEIIPIVIVAHSMGGLVVREALNLLDLGNPKLPQIEFVSLATPFGGHPFARSTSDTNMMILPSWRDLNPDNEFIRQLYRKPLPDNVTHHLFYAFSNEDHIKLGDNSDGVVPLSSQLRPQAQQESSRQLGLDVTHTGILTDPVAIAVIVETLSEVKTGYPDDHMSYFLQGGHDVKIGSVYNARDQYYLRYYGRYIEALAKGEIEPIGPWQEKLVPMLRGQAKPEFEPAKAWRKFIQNNSD
jgi:pimeloyl-ACP methyl ester carboxylesterase